MTGAIQRRFTALIVASCLLSGCASSLPTTRYEKMSHALGERAAPMTVAQLNRWVNRNFTFKEDKDVYGRADHWASLTEFLVNRGGDCEDFALAKRELLLTSGMAKAGDMRLLLVYDRKKRVHHAVLDLGGRALDNQTDKIIGINSAEFRQRYTPLTYAAPGEGRGK